jgi:hypothetical protein
MSDSKRTTCSTCGNYHAGDCVYDGYQQRCVVCGKTHDGSCREVSHAESGSGACRTCHKLHYGRCRYNSSRKWQHPRGSFRYGRTFGASGTSSFSGRMPTGASEFKSRYSTDTRNRSAIQDRMSFNLRGVRMLIHGADGSVVDLTADSCKFIDQRTNTNMAAVWNDGGSTSTFTHSSSTVF